jgi:hypothetical protein
VLGVLVGIDFGRIRLRVPLDGFDQRIWAVEAGQGGVPERRSQQDRSR